ncbi:MULTISPECIES: ricin-type beta-trefoil lectin domain protein [Actinoplanes]|uniref:ricin-type beta-trefoil lectin domain protein n=1 Tax=Actinoplanes TaxID=1865 RepID=UPI000B0100B4|nr:MULTISPECIES: ricin-type beta-trefoil lectin domain protein [Actinoplanes]GLY07043.1 hypothetical protein Acsp01_74220 [Actinoplanes sp. NBRC 101535]
MKRRKPLIGAVVGTVTAGLAAFGLSHAATSSAATGCGTLFDDFDYASTSDAKLKSRGWSLRSSTGAPGVSGAAWKPGNVAFPTVDGQKVAQLTASTDGTAAGTSHAEMVLGGLRFMEGTYLARIRFADTPVSGPDGDVLNQTFFAISPLARDNDPDYSELDFSEYLPNGGWGTSGATNFETSYHTYQVDPWKSDAQSDQQTKSLDGWHDVMATVGNGTVTYYIDGEVVATHGGRFYPRQRMSINFNQWFIDLTGHRAGSGTSTYRELVDYVYHAERRVLTPAQATSAVTALRNGGTRHTDTVVAADCDVKAPVTATPTPGKTTVKATPSPGKTTPSPGKTTVTTTAAPAGGLKSASSAKCIDVPGGKAVDGSLLKTWTCNGSAAQRWVPKSDGTLRALGLCMDPAGGALTDGTRIQLATCSRNPVQRFTLKSSGALVNVSSGKCVDIADRGAALQLKACSAAKTQKWVKG